ncbi:MAG: trigger factor [Eubacteriales bacterium]|nr:trigger factor [Eubacteriales bacterium]
MNATLISNEDNKAKFTMEFTAEEFDNAVNDVYKKQKNRFAVDGFRRGHAPMRMIERFYGEGIFFEDAVNNLVGDGYPEALDELDIETIDRPQADFSEIGHGKPMTVTIEVATYPSYDIAKDVYSGIDVDQAKTETTDEDVQHEIEALQERNARMEVVDRPVQDGDTVTLDYKGFVGDEQFEGGTAERQELKIGSGMFIPGFEEQLVGAKKDEAVEVKVTFPEDYQAADLRGKDAVFQCVIHEVKEEQKPELDDEFAKDVSEFDTLDELKEDTRKKLQEDKEKRAVNDAKNKLVDLIVDKSGVEIPQSMVENEIDGMIENFRTQLAYQGMDVNTYLKYTNTSMEDFRKSLEEDAKHYATGRAVLRSIANQENIEATDDEMNKELESLGQQYGMDADKMRESMGKSYLDTLRQDIRVRKAMDLIYDQANVSIVDEPEKTEEKPEDEAKETEAEKTEE